MQRPHSEQVSQQRTGNHRMLAIAPQNAARFFYRQLMGAPAAHKTAPNKGCRHSGSVRTKARLNLKRLQTNDLRTSHIPTNRLQAQKDATKCVAAGNAIPPTERPSCFAFLQVMYKLENPLAAGARKRPRSARSRMRRRNCAWRVVRRRGRQLRQARHRQRAYANA